MKLLFDANLSPKLIQPIAALFPGSTHLFRIPLPRDADDIDIWAYAKENGFDIVTTDGDDFPPLVKTLGAPPNVIVLESWRYPTKVALELIQRNAMAITELSQSNHGLLTLRA